MLVYNTALADEICALNAIYGEGTFTVTFSNSDHTTISLHLFDMAYAFQLHIAHTYPQSTPRVLGIDDLMQSRFVETQQYVMYFQACILAVHRPDGVCFFDAIEEFEPLFIMQKSHYTSLDLGLDVEKTENEERLIVLRELMDKARLGSLPLSGTGPDPYSDIVCCAVCMEPFFRIDAANLPCRHSFCQECLAGMSSQLPFSNDVENY